LDYKISIAITKNKEELKDKKIKYLHKLKKYEVKVEEFIDFREK